MNSISDIKTNELQKWQLADFVESERHIWPIKSHRKIWIICGCGRSWTTVTRVILDSHSKIYSGLESLLFLPIPIISSALSKKFDIPSKSLKELFPDIKSIRCFSESWKHIYESEVSNSLAKSCESWQEAIQDADVVITTTAKGSPYVRDTDLPNTVKCIVNLSLMDFNIDVFENSKIVVDDLWQCSKAKKIFKQWLDEGRINPDEVTEFWHLLFSDQDYNPDNKRVIFNPLGMGIEDIFCAKRIYDIALRKHRNQLSHL